MSKQVAQWDFQNITTRTSPPWPAFVLEVPLRNLLTSMCDFAPCDSLARVFPRFASVTYNYTSFDWFTDLSASFMIG